MFLMILSVNLIKKVTDKNKKITDRNSISNFYLFSRFKISFPQFLFQLLLLLEHLLNQLKVQCYGNGTYLYQQE